MNKTALEFRLDHYIGCVADNLPTALVPADSLAAVRKFARAIPGGVTSFFGFECPLSPLEERADFLFCSTRTEGHSKILAGLHPELTLPASLFEHGAWRRVRDFCQEWERNASGLHDALWNIWLEFDVADTQAPFVPSVFFGTQPRASDSAGSTNAELEFVRSTLTRLSAQKAHRSRDELLEALFESLPARSQVFQVGMMLARPTSAVRICIRGMSPLSIPEFVSKLGWLGQVNQLETLLNQLAALTERIDLDLDIDETLGTKIGLECYLGTGSHDSHKLEAFTNYLVDQAMCSVAKAHALCGYQGINHQDSKRTSWPAYLSTVAALRGRDTASLMHRWVHHIKVVHQPNQALAAKAYLAAEHHWLERSMFRAAGGISDAK